VLLVAAAPGYAAKWRHCPDQLGYYPSHIGAIGAPFIHPGREIGIFLSNSEQRSSGGFSTAVAGNTIHVTFASLFGSPVELPSFTATAVSPGTLYFTFPDASAVAGRPLAGPVAVTVTTGEQITADILPRHLVALPMANDVGAMVSGTGQQAAIATMDTRGGIWIPVQFSAFGEMEKPMPSCPMTLTPKTAFTVGVTVRATPSYMIGAPPAVPPFRVLRQVDLFLGDMLINGTNYYGMKVGKLPVFRVSRGWGIKVCGVNDAVDLVLHSAGFNRWAKPWSPFGAWMPDSQPLDIVLSHATADQGDLATGGLDAFGEACGLQ
jgi:hypothetical protein